MFYFFGVKIQVNSRWYFRISDDDSGGGASGNAPVGGAASSGLH